MNTKTCQQKSNREALVGDSPNWTHEELIEKALELTKPAELEFGEWHTDEGDDEE